MTKLNNTEKLFTLDGTTYTQTKTGYCYKTTGKQDKKGNDITIRIPRGIFEEKLEEYVKLDSWDTESEVNARKAKQEKSDREAEKAVNKPKKQSKRKPRKSKDIAYEGSGVTLTSKQKDFLEKLPGTGLWENGLESSIYCDELADEISGQFKGKPMTIGAMISTLREKGILSVGRAECKGKPKYIELTELGKEIATGLGLR